MPSYYLDKYIRFEGIESFARVFAPVRLSVRSRRREGGRWGWVAFLTGDLILLEGGLHSAVL